MPPQSPLAASPIGTVMPPGRSISRLGTWGKSLGKCRPLVDGRNPGTRTLVMRSSVRSAPPRRPAWPGSGRRSDDPRHHLPVPSITSPAPGEPRPRAPPDPGRPEPGHAGAPPTRSGAPKREGSPRRDRVRAAVHSLPAVHSPFPQWAGPDSQLRPKRSGVSVITRAASASGSPSPSRDTTRATPSATSAPGGSEAAAQRARARTLRVRALTRSCSSRAMASSKRFMGGDEPTPIAYTRAVPTMQPPWRFRGEPLALGGGGDGRHLRFVQPYRATKVYRCPGCQQEIFPRPLHVVVWPEGETSQRRHWHKACWERRFAELRRAARRGPPATEHLAAGQTGSA